MIHRRYMTSAQASLSLRAEKAGIRVDDYERSSMPTWWTPTRYPCIALYNPNGGEPLYVIETGPGGVLGRRRNTTYYQLINGKRFEVKRNQVEAWLSTKET